jgi:hypothetical protein
MSQYIALLQGSTAQAAFDQIVADAGALIAAAGAILVSWKGRARWEPWEEDVPKGPQQVAGLVTAVAIGVLWFYEIGRAHV